MRKNSPHIIIIGGGIIGTSIAFHLAKQGTQVTLIEAGELASGSSGACDGLVFMQSKKPGVHLRLAMESLKRFEALQKELPTDIEFRKTGGLVVIETETEYQAMEKYVKEQQAIGLDVQMLDTISTLKNEPFLSPEIIGSTYSPLDAQVNPINLTLGFAMAARKNHAKIMTGVKVKDILVENNQVTGVATTIGKIKADLVVNAAGSMAGLISQMVGIHMPIKPRRGQIVVTHAGKSILKHCLISAKYIAAKHDPALAGKKGQGISMEQTDNGNLLLGSTREFAGFNKENTLSGIRGIIKQTATVLPALKNFQVIRTFAGLRPFTPDGLPILGPVKSLDGFIMAAGHEGDGIALSPITGDLMSQMLLGKKPDICLDPFSPDRFLPDRFSDGRFENKDGI
ncbi:MAG: FAD-binding oxidoreductase [Desulfobacula sp.]|nr:FAD-binding oxidoreductase [Desulfobacula sp.]